MLLRADQWITAIALQEAQSRTLLSEGTPQVGLEPTTFRLTAERSTAELLRI